MISATRGSGADERPFNRLYDAVKVAQKQEPECFEREGEPLCTHEGQFYLFDENSLQPIDPEGRHDEGSGVGPTENEGDLFLSFPNDEQPPGPVVEESRRAT